MGPTEEEIARWGKAAYPTLLLPPTYSTEAEALRKAAQARDWNIHRVLRCQTPFTAGPIAVHGPLPFCDSVASRMMLGLLDPPDDWLGRLPQHFLLRDLWVGTVADLHRVKERSFVKPANDKVFQYGTYERGSDVPVRHIQDSCPIIVSEVVAWDLEVRLWILDRQIVAAEHYRIIGDHEPEDVTRQATAFGQQVLADPSYDLPSGVVLDVGHIEERGWAVVEANQAYASGIYGEQNHQAILDVVQRSSDGLEVVKPEDVKFVRKYLTT